ncbi:uncharacterized protein C8Q71DRAFT_440312 [Rhodofomes roseus]|uniref:Uncharacterized protein n=1 Tax=Rhodofomes roseus TaxID=34475 RepID=A0ABQ8KRW1_9APHY|nr:uncharacterized protein C8Q71DRAFT_440312 [Rhodofomes roseus]KAH9841127.1 hypothetical protein C8Q71DRAFT_440312 [Rhodofomes roseus]
MNAFSACSLYHEDLRVAMSRPLEQRVKFFLDTTDVEESSELGQLLPNLDLVRQDVARVSAVQETVASMPEQPVIELQEPYTGEDIQIRASHALVLKTQLPRLFLYSFLIMFSDVPKDLVEDVIWALEVFVGLLRECSDEQLDVLCSDELDAVYTYEEPAFEEDTPMETIRSFMRQQSKAKVTILLLRPEVDRPGDAVRYFKAIIDYRRLVVPPEQFFEGERDLLEVYGEALTRSGINDEFAETFLRKYVDSSAASDKTGLRRLIVAKVWLSRVLRRRGSTSAAKSEEKWLVRWFRKHICYRARITPSS